MSLKIIWLPITYVVCLNTIWVNVKPLEWHHSYYAHKSFAREIHTALFAWRPICLGRCRAEMQRVEDEAHTDRWAQNFSRGLEDVSETMLISFSVEENGWKRLVVWLLRYTCLFNCQMLHFLWHSCYWRQSINTGFCGSSCNAHVIWTVWIVILNLKQGTH